MEVFNKTDYLIFEALLNEKLCMSRLARRIDIAHTNLWKRLKKLEKKGVLQIPFAIKGKKKYPRITNPKDVSELLKLTKKIMGENNGN